MEEKLYVTGPHEKRNTPQGHSLQFLDSSTSASIGYSENNYEEDRPFTFAFNIRIDVEQESVNRNIAVFINKNGGFPFQLRRLKNSNDLRLTTRNGSTTNQYTINSVLEHDIWRSLAFVFSENSEGHTAIRAYVNGQVKGTYTTPYKLALEDSYIRFGGLSMQIDNVSMFKRALTDDSVNRLASGSDLQPHISGTWGPIIPWPHIPVSAATGLDGRIMTFSGSERTTWPKTEQTYSSIWDPETGRFFEDLLIGHNIFSGHGAMLADGKFLGNGGRNNTASKWTSLYDFESNSWIRERDMATGGRWYPTSLATGDGEVFTAMGTASNFANPEIFSTNQGWRVLNGIDFSKMRTSNDGTSGQQRWWATLSLAPSGDIFHFWTKEESHYINTEGNGSYRNAQVISSENHAPGVYIQYAEGKMIVTGSNQGSWGDSSSFDQAYTIDLNNSRPVFETTQNMKFARKFQNLVPLPTGEVMVVGGNTSGQGFRDTGTIYEGEIWNPESGTWRTTARMAVPRNYHSIALLLIDGRVLSAGGGYCSGNEFCNGSSHQNGQVYTPSYLYNEDGSLADRPEILTEPGDITPGASFNLSATETISKFTMIKMSSTTHAVNTDVRLHTVPFEALPNNEYELSPHSNGNVLSPGYWMLFAINESGIPSIAKSVKVLPKRLVATPGPVQFIKLTSLSEVNNKPWAALAEIEVLDGSGDSIKRNLWDISASSVDLKGPAINAIDGNINTIWHTDWQTNPGTVNDPSHPHSLIINMKSAYTVSGIRYTPRTVGVNGRIKDYQLFVSNDGENWSLVKEGAFPGGEQTRDIEFGIEGEDIGILGNPSEMDSTATFSTGAGDSNEYQWSFGDGTPVNNYSTDPSAVHDYLAPGRYNVVVKVRDIRTGLETEHTIIHVVYNPKISDYPAGQSLASTSILFDENSQELWVVNPDNDTVTVIDSQNFSKKSEVSVGKHPVSLALASNERLWVSNKSDASISIIDTNTKQVVETITLDSNSSPHGIMIRGDKAYVSLEASKKILQFSTDTRLVEQMVSTQGARHLAIDPEGYRLYAAVFVTPNLAGEHTATPQVESGVEAIEVFDLASLGIVKNIKLAYSDQMVSEAGGPGIPNYITGIAIHPAGDIAYVPSKQDNILGGELRGQSDLVFDQTVRAIISRLDLKNDTEQSGLRIDHDNASISSGSVFGPYGELVFTALEGNQQVAVSAVGSNSEFTRFDTGRAPQGITISADGETLAVHNFMDRTVSFFDIRAITRGERDSVDLIETVSLVGSEKLSGIVLQGKKLFYDAKDDRLAQLDYLSCASCHNDGGDDGRVWDFTSFGEGLRNTISLRGKGKGQGPLHWSGNFDEVQDFEGQIREHSLGFGLMSDAEFFQGTRSEPFGDKKAGISSDLDALAAYVKSLNKHDLSPLRGVSGLSADALVGQELFKTKGCDSCHNGPHLSDSSKGLRHDVGTIKGTSGGRLSSVLDGLDTPTLLGLFSSKPYLHDGSAATVSEAILQHNTELPLSLDDADRISRFLLEISPDDVEEQEEDKLMLQVGRVTFKQEGESYWHAVVFDEEFDEIPLVTVGPSTFNGGDGVSTRVRRITRTGFDLMIDEWDYKDGVHAAETVDYLAILPGIHDIGGLKVIAESRLINHNAVNHSFSESFDSIPVVFTQVSSFNGASATIVRAKNITTSQIQLKLDEEEKNDRRHLLETVSIIAFEQGSADFRNLSFSFLTRNVDHTRKAINLPSNAGTTLIFADMQTTTGGDPCTLRIDDKTSSGFDIFVHEEKSKNSEMGHSKESIGIMFITKNN